MNLNEDRIVALLSAKHTPPEWGFWSQVRNITGYAGGRESIIDAYAVNCYPSKGQHMVSYEVKISRNDFKKEIEDPGKREFFVQNSTQFYFVTPNKLIDASEVPEECGLMYVTSTGKLRTIKIAPQRRLDTIPIPFFRSLVRNLDRRDMYNLDLFKLAGKDYTYEDLDKEIDILFKSRVHSLNYELEKEKEQIVKEAKKSALLSVYRELGIDSSCYNPYYPEKPIKEHIESLTKGMSPDDIKAQRLKEFKISVRSMLREIETTINNY